MGYTHLSDDEFGKEAFAKLDPLVESELVIELLDRFALLLDMRDEAIALNKACRGLEIERVKAVFDWLDKMPDLTGDEENEH